LLPGATWFTAEVAENAEEEKVFLVIQRSDQRRRIWVLVPPSPKGARGLIPPLLAAGAE